MLPGLMYSIFSMSHSLMRTSPEPKKVERFSTGFSAFGPGGFQLLVLGNEGIQFHEIRSRVFMDPWRRVNRS